MMIEDVVFTLKDGRRALIRNPREEDIPDVLYLLRKTAEESDFLLRYPEECDRYTPEGEKELFAHMNHADNEAMLVCLVDGRVVGNCQISWSKRLKTRHRASIGIGLLRAYWNLGIGTRLLQELIRIAERNENLLQIELDFVEGNSRARALYEKLGFRITGVKPNAIRLKDGSLLHEYAMVKLLREPK